MFSVSLSFINFLQTSSPTLFSCSLFRLQMELDPITADFPSRTAREEDEEAAERATSGGLAPEAVAIVRKEFDGLMASERSKPSDWKRPSRSPSFSHSLSFQLQSHPVDP